jgi:hypothetical protein
MTEPQGQHQQSIKCFNKDCGKEFAVFAAPPEVINSMTLSMVVWTHPDVQSCPHCGTPYQMMVRKIQGVEVAWSPVRTKGDTGIVVPPPGFKLPKPGVQ